MVSPQTEVLISRDGIALARHIFEPGEYLVGSGADCAVRLDDAAVSPRQAQLTINYDEILLESIDLSGEVFLNDKAVTGAARVWPTQKIRIGSVLLEARRLKAPRSGETLPPWSEQLQRLIPEEARDERKYEIGGEVAQGGMGIIVDARDRVLRRGVAMKVLLDQCSPEHVLRFVGEAQITGQLEHPNIVPIHELGVDEYGKPFYTMKFVRGQTLRAIVEGMASGNPEAIAKYPLAALLTVFQKVCDAVAFAHSKGIIHRDLKPENIMIGRFGEVCVMDWGLAKVLARDQEGGGQAREGIAETPPRRSNVQGENGAGTGNQVRPSGSGTVRSYGVSMVSDARTDEGEFGCTMAGTIIGTPRFMSPEQARGETESLDQPSDIYALGAILYNILALRPPVEGDSAPEILAKVTRGEIAPLAKAVGGRREASQPHCPGGRIPEALAAVAARAMALLPANRYGSVKALQDDLAAYQNGFATRAEKAGVLTQLALLIKRHRGVFNTAAAAWLIIMALAVWFVVNVTRAKNQAIAERSLATASEARAVENAKRATETLASLRGTAPTFAAQANALTEKQDFAAGLQKIDYAIELNPAEAEYRCTKGNLLETLYRFAEAVKAYDEALELNPKHVFAKENRDLCAQIVHDETGSKDPSKASLNRLNQLMRKEGRTAEAIASLGALTKDRQPLLESWLGAIQKAVTSFSRDEITLNDDGLFSVDLHRHKEIEDISFLRGMPLIQLVLDYTRTSDLGPLQGAPLRVLSLTNCPVIDLSGLRHLPLVDLTLIGTKARDLSPLAGMPLARLILADLHRTTPVADLGPLSGMPLHTLWIYGAQIHDLSPLKGMPLTELVAGQTSVGDLSPLQGMPLKRLTIGDSPRITSLDALKGMSLEILNITGLSVSDLRPLRGMPLKEIEMQNSRVTDLKPLSGMQLKRVRIAGGVVDLSPLKGQPIDEAGLLESAVTDFSTIQTWPLKLALSVRDTKFGDADLPLLKGKPLESCLDLQNTAVTDLSSLRGLRTRIVYLFGSKVIDLHPLANLPSLEIVTLPAEATDIEFLRELPNLQRITQTLGKADKLELAADFWKRYDTRKAAEKKP